MVIKSSENEQSKNNVYCMICLSVEVRATCISVRRLEGCNTTCAYVLVDVCDFFQSPPLYLNFHFS